MYSYTGSYSVTDGRSVAGGRGRTSSYSVAGRSSVAGGRGTVTLAVTV